MKKLGTGTKSLKRAGKFKLASCGWTQELQGSYDRLRLAVVASIKQAYRDYDKICCLFWDASKYAWSYSITQVAPEEIAKPWDQQQHSMLVTRSGLFRNSELDWGIGCKEAYAPWRAVKRDGKYLRGRRPWLARGDHANITYVQVRRKRPPNLGTASQTASTGGVWTGPTRTSRSTQSRGR